MVAAAVYIMEAVKLQLPASYDIAAIGDERKGLFSPQRVSF